MMEYPLNRARRLAVENQVENLLVTSPINLQYVTGVALSRGILLITLTEAFLYIDPRYAFVAATLTPQIQVIVSSSGTEERERLSQQLSMLPGRLGFDSATMTVDQWQALAALSPKPLCAVPRVFCELRRPKRPDEVAAIEAACHLCSKGFEYLVSQLHEGVTEDQLAQALKAFWFTHGAEAISFEPIIAFGPNSACPHWLHSSHALSKGVPVLMDIGVSVRGYHSDMTRTLFFGQPDPELVTCYSIVRQAYERAVSLARPGMLPHELDATIRRQIADAGYPHCFGHGLGHGIGLEVHEFPRISSSAPHESPLQQGDVIAVEPGIYLPGRGGIRLENTVVVEERGARPLTRTSLDPRFL